MKLAELQVFHGTPDKIRGALRAPLFVTTDKEGARVYGTAFGSVQNHGYILHGEFWATKTLDATKPAGYKQMLKIAADASIEFTDEHGEFECPEITDHVGHKEGENPFDLVYIPRFVKAIKDKGYDSIHCKDALFGSQIDTYILLSTNQFKIVKREKVK